MVRGAIGSGKSTLLTILYGLVRPDLGRIVMEGKDITELSEDDLAPLRNRSFGFVYQAFHLVPCRQLVAICVS